MINYISIALFGYWFACLIPKINLIDRKPFSCEKCMSFWIALIYASYSERHIGYAILYAGLTSFLSIIIGKLYTKWI